MLHKGRRAASFFTPQAQLLFAEMTTSPTFDRMVVINTFIRSLIYGGIWDKLDLLYVLAAANEQAALLNWVTPGAYTLSKTGSPTFNADTNFKPTSGGQYLGTAWDPVNEGVNFTTNSAHYSLYSTTNQYADSSNCIVFGNSSVNLRNGSISKMGVSLNNVGVFTSGSLSTTIGHFMFNRESASSYTIHQNDSLFETETITAVNPTSTDLQILQMTGVTANRRGMSFVSIGGGLTTTQATAFYDAFEVYRASLGF
ncbi:MAG: hypothetical protein GY749_22705 [Desulfobacteraceae bacterium]|nr:hypothetical protein [Desulfobacteraceae bacterium]